MRVIAIDPGYDRLGVAVLESQYQKENLLFSTCIETKREDTISDRLHVIGVSVKKLIEEYKPDSMAVETLFFNKNIKTALIVAQARGVLLYIGTQVDCAIYEFGPQEIKIAVTGHGQSSKQAVKSMVQRLIYNAPDNALDDEYDAIAVGITCLAHHGRNR